MKYKSVYVIFLILLSSISYAQNSAQISGYVTDNSNGLAITGAEIFVAGGDSTFYYTQTDSLGNYIIENLSYDQYYVQATAPNYIAQYKVILLNDSIPNATANFALEPENTPSGNLIAGQVFEYSNFSPFFPPVEGATLLLQNNFYTYRDTTNQQGEYKFQDIEPGQYETIVTAPGYSVFNDTLTVEENTYINGLNFYLESTDTTGMVTFQGHVLDAIDSSLVVYPATITLIGNTVGDSAIYYLANNPDGSFEFENILPGTYDIYVYATDYQPFQLNAFEINSDVLNFQILLEPVQPAVSGFISGQVNFEQSNLPVNPAFIEFIPLNGPGFYSTTSGSGGNYAQQLPVGQYYVMLQYFGTDSLGAYYREYYDDVFNIQDAQVVNVSENDTTAGIDFEIPGNNLSSIEITGFVSDSSGAPLENAIVRLWPLSPGVNDSIYATTDASGNYNMTIDFDPLQFSFSFVLSAEKDGYRTEFYDQQSAFYLANQFMVTSDTLISAINFSLESGNASYSLSGSVTDQGGFPISAAFVLAFDNMSGQVYFSFTDPLGNYTIQDMYAGEYYVLFYAENYIPEFYDDVPLVWEDATPVMVNGNISGINAQLEQVVPDSGMNMISGTVTDQSGQPLPGVMIVIRDQFNQIRDYVFTDDQGSYILENINDGIRHVHAAKVTYVSSVKTLDVNHNQSVMHQVDFTMDQTVTNITQQEPAQIPDKIFLDDNYPNPFNPVTTIRFGLPQAEIVRLEVYNMLGERLDILLNRELTAGYHTVQFNGANLASGTYLLRLQAGEFAAMKKVVLLK